MATVTSSSANQTLSGTVSGDTYVFTGNFGVDSIVDSGGNDTIDLSAITTSLTIYMTAASTRDEVTAGTNRINWSGNIIENAYGGSGNDRIIGSTANNLIRGNAGEDNLEGGLGNDTLEGGAGNDFLSGSAGNDSLDGGDGDDNYYFYNSWGVGTITDSNGTDTLQMKSVTTHLTMSLTTGAGVEITSGANTIELGTAGIEWVISGAGNDEITGNSLDNSIFGNNGDDTLSGGDGNDRLYGNLGSNSLEGEGGNDTLTSDTGDDTLEGGLGNDWLTSGSGQTSMGGGDGNDSLLGGTGHETMDGGSGNDYYVIRSNAYGLDSIGDSAGRDMIDLRGVSNSLVVNLTAGAGNEVTSGTNTLNWTGDVIEDVQGGSAGDLIEGSSGNNWLYGWSGNDTLSSNGGNDTLDGGSDDDTYVFSGAFGTVQINYETTGTDTLDFSGITNALTANLMGTGVNDVTDGTNTVNFSSGIPFEEVLGGTGSDVIYADASNNTLDGGVGNDSLLGGSGDDSYEGYGAVGFDSDTSKTSVALPMRLT